MGGVKRSVKAEIFKPAHQGGEAVPRVGLIRPAMNRKARLGPIKDAELLALGHVGTRPVPDCLSGPVKLETDVGQVVVIEQIPWRLLTIPVSHKLGQKMESERHLGQGGGP